MFANSGVFHGNKLCKYQTPQKIKEPVTSLLFVPGFWVASSVGSGSG